MVCVWAIKLANQLYAWVWGNSLLS
jgi:hypothetical protein